MDNHREMSQSRKQNNHYTKFILMLICSFMAMYITMYFNAYASDHVYITDMMGRSVLQQQLPQELTTAINTDKLIPGTYLVSVMGKNATKIQRLIVK